MVKIAEFAVIGFGEVGQCYAAGFARAGLGVSACDIRPTDASRSVAAALKTPLHEAAGDWLARADVVFGCVEGHACLRAIRSALPFMRPDAFYLDLSTADPADKRTAAEEARSRSVAYVDVALVGAPSIYGVRSPVILAGEKADAASGVFRDLQAPVRIVPGPAGDAIALKLLRSVFIKGLEALAVDAFSAAQKQGLRDVLFEILQDIDDSPFSRFVETLLRTHPVHARRRMHEVEEAERQLHLAGLSAQSLSGVKDVYRRSVAAIDDGRGPRAVSSVADSLDWILEIARKQDKAGADSAPKTEVGTDAAH